MENKTRAEMEDVVWKKAPPSFRSIRNGERHILYMDGHGPGGLTVCPLSTIPQHILAYLASLTPPYASFACFE